MTEQYHSALVKLSLARRALRLVDLYWARLSGNVNPYAMTEDERNTIFRGVCWNMLNTVARLIRVGGESFACGVVGVPIVHFYLREREPGIQPCTFKYDNFLMANYLYFRKE
jgi:hypothetical protein